MKMKNLFPAVLVAAGVALATAVSAQVITPTSITAVGSFSNSLSVVADGFVPPENTFWTDPVNVFWTGFDTAITLDYGASHRITDVLVSVDNNDVYRLDYSLDGINYTPLFTILTTDGNVQVSPGGMDTMSTDSSSPEFVSGIDFTPVDARFLRFQAITGGDTLSSVGEIMAVSAELGGAVPEPSTYGWLGAAVLLGIAMIRRRRPRTT
jgi:MYXO-CTERM domain-containing protein